MVPPILIRRFFPAVEGELWPHWLHHVERLLAGIFGLVGLVMWKRFLGEGSEAQGMTQGILSGALQKTWSQSGSMSGREFEHFMADLLREVASVRQCGGVFRTPVMRRPTRRSG